MKGGQIMRAMLQERARTHNSSGTENKENTNKDNEQDFQIDSPPIFDLLQKKYVQSDSEQGNENIEQQIYEQQQYMQNKLLQIRSVTTMDDLKHLFQGITSEEGFNNPKSVNFATSISQLTDNLEIIHRNLTGANARSIIEQLLERFINDNSFVFDQTGEIGTKEYAKKNIIPEYFRNKNSSGMLTAEMMKVILTDSEQKFVPQSYRNIQSKLFDWLLNTQYSIQHKDYDKMEHKTGPDQDISACSQRVLGNIPYQGYISGVSSELNRLYDRRVTLENEKRDEILLLNRKYPSDKRRNFISTTSKRKFASKMLNIDKELYFSNDDLNMPYGEKVTHEDKMYALVDIFYNKKMKAINEQERDLIKKNQNKFENQSFNIVLRESKRDINMNFYSQMFVPMNSIRELNRYKYDLNMHSNSFVNMPKDERLGLIQKKTIESIFTGVSNKVGSLLNNVAGYSGGAEASNPLQKPLDPLETTKPPFKESSKATNIFNILSLFGVFGGAFNKNTTTALTTTKRGDIVKS